MGGMASTPQNTSKIDFLRMSLPCACRLYGSSLLKRDGEGRDLSAYSGLVARNYFRNVRAEKSFR